jgi:hypothetical protein
MEVRRGPIGPFPLHGPDASTITAPVVHILRRVGNLAPLGACSKRQHNGKRSTCPTGVRY